MDSGVTCTAEAPTAEMTAFPTPMEGAVDSILSATTGTAVTGTPVTGAGGPSTVVTGAAVTDTTVIGTPDTGILTCLRARRERPAPR